MIKMSVEGEKNQYNWRVTEYNSKLKSGKRIILKTTWSL
jgi:hypothetical protein